MQLKITGYNRLQQMIRFMEDPAPVEVGSLSHCLAFFSYIPGGAGFLYISSINSIRENILKFP